MNTSIALNILKHGLQAVVFNTIIALGISTFVTHQFMASMVYSQCIGLSCWGLIDLSRVWLVTDSKRHWRRLFWIVPISVCVGYVLGTMAGDALLGYQSMNGWTEEPRKALGYLFVSLVAGGASAYYFLSRAQLAVVREDMARADAQAQAAQRHAAESQLKLLQTQLEPHMLFNTLANLRAMIGVDPAQAQEMLDRLVAYLRATLSASRATAHPLQAEFDRLQDYLELMAVRMGPRLHYTLDLPPELAGQLVPPLLLQALVENSIKHGLEPKVEGGSISVTARQAGTRFTLEVSDTGAGSTADLNQPQGTSTSFGLAQVRERLQASYGDQATLKFIANSAGGTSASITFPSQP
jgi:signal transduction histidine kinase